MTTTVGAKSTLGELASWVRSQDAASELESIVFSSAFPRCVLLVLFASKGQRLTVSHASLRRKTFAAADEGRSMEELGLVPSAVLMLS